MRSENSESGTLSQSLETAGVNTPAPVVPLQSGTLSQSLETAGVTPAPTGLEKGSADKTTLENEKLLGRDEQKAVHQKNLFGGKTAALPGTLATLSSCAWIACPLWSVPGAYMLAYTSMGVHHDRQMLLTAAAAFDV